MQDGIDDYDMTKVKPKIAVNVNPYFSLARKASKKIKKSGKNLLEI